MPESIYEKKPWLKHYDSFVPESLEYPAISVSDFVEASVRDFPESPAIYHGKRKITFSEFGDYITRFAAALADKGVGKGDRVGILCLNMLQYLIAFYGALKIGAVPTGINPLLTPRELKYILNDSDAETIVALDLFLPRVQEIKGETSLRNVIVTGLGDFPQEGPLPTPQEAEGATVSRHAQTRTKPPRGRNKSEGRLGPASVHRRHNRSTQGDDTNPRKHCSKHDSARKVGKAGERERGGLLIVPVLPPSRPRV